MNLHPYASLLKNYLHVQPLVQVVLLLVHILFQVFDDDLRTQTENRHLLLDLDTYYSGSRLNIHEPDNSDKKAVVYENKNGDGSSFESIASGSGGR